MKFSAKFDRYLIRRYDTSGPRYTSYPTAAQFHTRFTESDYRQAAQQSQVETSSRPLSLYIHIPFCNTLCFYCACNKVVTNNRGHIPPYLSRLAVEIGRQGELFNRERRVDQLHWGGGTPNFLNLEQITGVMKNLHSHFTLRDDDAGEYAIEIDPRQADADFVTGLRDLGFNRLSIGVQDFNPRVQQAVNRVQSEADTRTVIDAARTSGFHSVSVDLIYGLPLQTVTGFNETLDAIIAISPDRLSVFNYAHLPQRFKPQRRIQEKDLPTPAEKLEIMESTISRLTDAGYVYIGMDHFSKPVDDLAVAQQEGTLYRNFQGYSTHADCDLIGLGISAISQVGNCFAQNVYTLEQYYFNIDNGKLAIQQGVSMTTDDQIRRAVIMQLICHFTVDYEVIEKRFSIDFRDYFASELQKLVLMADDGLLDYDDVGIRVQPIGRLLIRNICMAFDSYLQQPKTVAYSRVI